MILWERRGPQYDRVLGSCIVAEIFRGGAPPDEPAAEPTELPPLPDGVPRIDALPETFVALLSHRPHLPGDIIASRYQLEKLLGDGAMGQVFSAVNLAIRRRVAIKVLKPEVLADAQFCARFQREAEAIARIEHRNVAHFIDLVISDPTFLVMEYVAGPTLAAVLRKEGRLEPRRAVAIALRLCWALEAAHTAGIIHRDVKPGNVILAPDPELGEEPKLIDFGLAKLVTNVETPTRTGQIVGTPQYMAPEQIANQPVDPRTDVYALGCVLYHMIAGRPPFEGDTDVQLMYQHMQEAPQPLSAFTRDLPPGIEAVLERALAKERSARFPSMRELARALGGLERRRRSASSDDSATQDRQVRVRRVVGLGLLATVLAAGIGWVVGARGGSPRLETLLVVDTVPSGAQLSIDGKVERAPTPVAMSGLPPGRHTVAITLKGRAPVDRVVELEAGQREVLTVQLPPSYHALHVETQPTGATVILDDKLQGLTPITLQLSDDDFHELRLEKNGYEMIKRGITPELKDPSISFTLQAQTRAVARLIVSGDLTLPVFVDGLDSGFVAPTIPLEVLAGTHTVELRDYDGKIVATQKVSVLKGETRRLRLSAKASP
jgi:tRNA A-37 threonylcarbamoyl transferase component Bud32